ncbi:metallophosphoesterase [Histomonas meleagridis]|uniref:metallophosphoesterase n=1 Tax=Histomonas meleagridis TaxID=135588 RepID=UPI0035593B73|nr:metallophosphoesterase [Histomonas meleagridis]KAH0803053.1 metallophosphoesterase [Histomonas meleagridis]
MHIEPFTLKIQRFSFRSNRSNFPPLKIVQITDTHVHYPYPQVTYSRLKSIVNLINFENPDLVVLTGDLISDKSKHSTQDVYTIANSLKYLNSPLFVCFGNHDVECQSELTEALSNIGATVLNQQTVEFPVRGSKIYISGLKPSLKLFETNLFVAELKSNFTGDPTVPHILLAHMPDAADAASESQMFDLQLSGHSHGGQCVLPFNAGTPFLPPGSLKYHACVTSNYLVGDMILHISRGIGETPLPYPLIRFLCKPEISVIELKPNII